MGLWLRQSTSVDVLIGPFLDSSDGNTEEAGLTIEDSDIQLSKLGQAMGDKNDVNDATIDDLGMYNCPLNATDTNTLGTLQLTVHMAGALIVYHEYMVVTQQVWDSFFGADMLQSDLTQIGGVAQSATDLKDFADAGYDPATDKVNGVKLVDLTTLTTTTTTATTTTNVTNDVGITQAGADKAWGTAARALTDKANFTLSAVGIDAIIDEVIEGALTLREAIRLTVAMMAGKSSGGGTNTLIYRNYGDTLNRLTFTVTAVGNRTASVRNLG